LERLPHDRTSSSAAREVVALFRRNPHSWLTPEDVSSRVKHPVETERILDVLSDCFVLDFQDGPPRYRICPDTHLEIEVDRFLRRVEQGDRRIQTNVARFRRRYHCS
jgi:hypothetical protein